MTAKLSPLLSRLTDFCWLFFPPLLFFSALYGCYFFNTKLIGNWILNLWWMSYASLAIAAIIAWQFGRSRLVYACLLLLLIAANKQLTLNPELLEVRYSGILFGFVFLLYSRDKGFSAINLCFSIVVLLTLFGLSWLAIPALQLLSQAWLTSLDSLLFQLSPDLRALVTPFNSVLFIVSLLLGLLRLLLKTDNTHNALYFALVLSAVMHIYSDAEFGLITIVSLASLFCYSVLKDSFTMAFKDELTGIPSRRALMQYVQTLGRKYTVVMSDIDHFKRFNDTYGHDVGDEVLKLVASKLDKVTGGGKTFRFGGEEFIIVFPRKTSAEVMPFVELVRQTIADYDIALRAKPRPPKPKKPLASKKPAATKPVKVTTSFGVAQRTKEHADFASIMKQADIALYAAKKGGRNCVRIAKQ
ncbi:GGDEF domain-containing protein [Paraglaciecola sp. MB-3u-78]|uniref:GGDEF domain-containing protein n=1 Tax=Paraglaciecola sp. MB-3u-78 TaxID=2058332 RepID=UPI000C31CA1F|nr:GGDEF domain-containing protein [Paraglaciecola sp. MB-3u-78]PKG96832.1 GGDEF domain-containing protein [Paraglaciecola sp. MB-3u-78]